MVKLSEKIEEHKKLAPNRPHISLEFFPPKTEMGVINLYDRFDRFSILNPLWVDVTWGAGGSTAQQTLEICASAMKYHGLEALMHLTCTNMMKDVLDKTLQDCKDNGIMNILALRGDPPAEMESWTPVEGGFEHAVDLVKYIRETHGNYFCVAVAGYPEGHLENPDKDDDLRRLKEKVDAGASLVITQLFYDINEFLDFERRAREIGIDCPIIPGIMPIQSYTGFKKMTTFCKTFVPEKITTALEFVKEDDQKVKDYGVAHAVEMCKQLLDSGRVGGLHFYTLNLEVSVFRIIESLHLIDMHVSNKSLPWRPVLGNRVSEQVRPIFWANRPKSYIHRTSGWDDFPNGRWGDRDSPAYGEPCLSMCGDPDDRSMAHRREMWGESLESIEDVKRTFVNYLKGSIITRRLPWCPEVPGDETNVIKKQLVKLNMCGLLTINSQPRVNSALSSDPYFGWGPKNGFVFQKAYAEFFCSPRTLEILQQNVAKDPQLTYATVNVKGDHRTNCEGCINAVTWGVFPGEEIKQPTIVDEESFIVWKDEAFALWLHQWASIYPQDSLSRKVIQGIHDSWYLVNIVDNNFVCGDLFNKLVQYVQAN